MNTRPLPSANDRAPYPDWSESLQKKSKASLISAIAKLHGTLDAAIVALETRSADRKKFAEHVRLVLSHYWK